MHDSETISNMFTYFTNIVNGLKTLYRTIPNIELVSKLLRWLKKSWKLKVTAILEVKDLNKLDLDQLIRSLTTYEIINSNENDKMKKKKGPVLKTYPDGDHEYYNDEDLAFL